MADDTQNTLLADTTTVAQLLRQADQAFGTTLLTTWQDGQISNDQLLQLLPELQYSALARQLIDDQKFSADFLPSDLDPVVLTAPSQVGVTATSAFSLYNIQDRWRDAVYRRMTGATGLLNRWTASWEGLANFRDESAAARGGRFVDIANAEASEKYAQRVNGWRYEARSAILQSHFYATGAWLTLGAMMYGNSSLGSADADKREAGKVALARQIITTAVYTTSLFGTSVRWQDDVRRGKVTAEGRKAGGAATPGDAALIASADRAVMVRDVLSTGGLFVLTLSNVVGLTFASMKLNKLLNDPNSTTRDRTAAELEVSAQGLFILTNASKAMGGLTTLLGRLRANGSANYQLGLTAKTWQIAGTAFGVAQSAVSIGITASALARPGLSAEEKAMVVAELATQVTGSALQAGSSALLAARIASGGALAGAAVGAAVGGMMLALSPIQIYGLVKQSQYADALNDLGQRMRDYGYGGDLLLSDMYDAKTEIDRNYLIATNVLATVGTAVSVAAACSVVGAPLAGVVSLATAIAGALLPLAQSAELEKIARDFAGKIDAAGGSRAFFGASLQANYNVMLADPNLSDYLRRLQASYGVDRVIAATTVNLSSTALELAALARRAVDLQTSTAEIESYVNGQRQADGTVNIDPANGVLNLGGAAGTSQLLTFLTPLMTAGAEVRERVSTGKNGYYEGLEVVFGSSPDQKGVWTFNDGAANTVMDLRNVATRFVLTNVPTPVINVTTEISHDVELHVNGGDGDDTVLASPGAAMAFDGGAGHDSVSYATMNGTRGGIAVYADGTGGFTVMKTATNASVYIEGAAKHEYSYGKRTETVYYRDIELGTRDIQQVDQLRNVEEITGSPFADSFNGIGLNNFVFHGGDGNDTLSGGDGDDVLDPGTGSNLVIGGLGQDTLDYQSLSGQSIQLVRDARLPFFNVFKYDDARGAPVGDVDAVFQIENVRGTTGNDLITGDTNDNRLWGGAGNDLLSGDDGNDLLVGGTGFNRLYGGAGIDTISYADYATDEWGVGVYVDTREGRPANDGWQTPGGPVAVHSYYMSGFCGEGARLEYDMLSGIENVNGTAQADVFKGDASNNVFCGGAGADTYTMRSGFGQDTIVESGTDSDLVVFDATSSQLWFRHVGNDLVINALGTNDALTVKDWYGGSTGQVETLRAGDGKALLNSQVDALVAAMAGYTMPATGPVSNLPNYSANLAPAMAGWH
jgi:Ca2+-binding RTX toxin-like protein